MISAPRLRPWVAVPALLLALPPSARPQSTNATPQQQAAAPAKDPATKKILTLADYGRWNRIASSAISPDGKWVAYVFQPNDGDGTLFVKQLDGDKIFTVPVGSVP